jgi:hypothetical protein
MFLINIRGRSMARSLRFMRVHLLVALATFGVVGRSEAGEFLICSHAQGNEPQTVPYIYSPAYHPGHPLELVGDDPRVVLKPTCWVYQSPDICLGVSYFWYNCRPVWYSWLRVSERLAHQPLSFEYPNFKQSPWFEAFWTEFSAAHPDLLDVAKAKAAFWDKFVEVCPKTFPEAMRYYHGLESPDGTPGTAGFPTLVDIKPGMRLRIENAAWQQPPGNPSNPSPFQGYVGTGTTYLSISKQENFLSFDPFLGHIDQHAGIPRVEGRSNLGSGSLDLHVGYGRQPYFRLYYPDNYFKSQVPQGPPRPAEDILLIGGPSREVLAPTECRTLLDRAVWSDSAATDPLGKQRLLMAFRGRAAVIPEIQVEINGETTFVPVGTTLRQVLDRSWDWAEDRPWTKVCLERRFQGGIYYVRVGRDREKHYDVPLVKGDRVSW